MVFAHRKSPWAPRAAPSSRLVSTAHATLARVLSKRIERFKRVSLEAAKQCGRSQLPVIETPKPFEALARPDAMVLTPGAPPLDSSEKLSTNPVVLVGPEGGWSAPELHLAQDRELTVFGLGPRTMRTETAAIAAATLMQWLGGDLR